MSRALPARVSLPVIFGVALATGFSGAVVPGTLLAVVVRESVHVGWQAGPLMMIGHGMLELMAMALLATGLIAFARSGRVRGAIGVLGGLTLLYLGYLTLGLSGEAGAEALRPVSMAAGVGTLGAQEAIRLAALGALMSAANPYWWMWWATIGVAHVGWATGGGEARPALRGAIYFTGHVLSDVVWYCAVGIALSAGRGLFSAPLLRGIYLGCGFFLLGLGAAFAVTGVRAFAATHMRHD